jgi:acyl-CoA thioester hydrolase
MNMEVTRPDALAAFPVVIALPIQWGEQDAFGHVNNTVPIRWFESSRIAYLEQGGLSHLMSGQGLGPILASITCNYRRQLHYPDTVLVGARITRLGRSSLTMTHAVYSQAHSAVAADGESVIVVFDYTANRPRRIPEEMRQAMERLEGSSFSE